MVIYEPSLEDEEMFCDLKVIKSIDEFKNMCDVIIANRFDEQLSDVEEKVYTRDLFRRD